MALPSVMTAADVDAAYGNVRAKYVGQVATRCMIPQSANGSSTTQMTRSPHVARDAIVGQMRVEFPNFRAPSGTGEVGPGAVASITASVEFPMGVFTQMTFSGAVMGTAPDNGRLLSDNINIYIPKGALFFVRVWRQCSAGIIYCGAGGSGAAATVSDCAMLTGGNGLADLTMGGPVFSSSIANINNYYTPCAIIAPTALPSFGLIGDSRVYGLLDVATAKNFDMGNLARSIGQDYAYINMGVPGETLLGFNTGYTNRLALADYCSHRVLQLGYNDLGSGGAAVITRFTAAMAILGTSKPIITATMEPYATSTDGFATTTNQTIANAGQNSARISENNRRRAGISGILTCFDIADGAESARDSGLWMPGYTDEGVHANQKGNIGIRDSGRVYHRAVA
jgi:hypothetical protein